jgi:hypothetical protein
VVTHSGAIGTVAKIVILEYAAPDRAAPV